MNYRFVQVQSEAEFNRFCVSPYLPALEPGVVKRQGPEGQWLVVGPEGEVAGRCSLWWRKAPPYPGQRVGVIGHYGAREGEAGQRILDLACQQLAAQGCSLAIGPMDGNTWQPYRLVTGRGEEPSFFLEPDHPADWPHHFTESGFSVLARYYSTLQPTLEAGHDSRLAAVAERAARRGLQIRPFDLARFEVDLAQLYGVARASFQQNFLYTPIGEAEFKAMYAPLRPYIRPELGLIAEQDGQAIAFLFALPDWLQARRGQEVDTVIIKTVAAHPDYQAGGLGSLLVAQCHQAAYQLGYRRVIHALMHEKNSSRKLSGRYQTAVMREYALFSRGM